MTVAAARVGRGVPTGGQFAARSRPTDTIALTFLPVDELALRLERREIGAWSVDDEAHMLPISRLGLTSYAGDDIAFDEISARIDPVFRDPDLMPAPETIELATIDGTMQDSVRADALAWYLRRAADDETQFDTDNGFYGNTAPLLIDLSDGRRVTIDGTHRYARAAIIGSPTIRVQLLRLPGA